MPADGIAGLDARARRPGLSVQAPPQQVRPTLPAAGPAVLTRAARHQNLPRHRTRRRRGAGSRPAGHQAAGRPRRGRRERPRDPGDPGRDPRRDRQPEPHPGPAHRSAGAGAGLRLPHRRVAAGRRPCQPARPGRRAAAPRPAPTGCSSPIRTGSSRPGPPTATSSTRTSPAARSSAERWRDRPTAGLWLEPGEQGDELYQAVGVPVASPGIEHPAWDRGSGGADRQRVRGAAPAAHQLRDRLLLPRHAGHAPRRGVHPPRRSGARRDPPRCRSTAPRRTACRSRFRLVANGVRVRRHHRAALDRRRRADRRLRRAPLARRRAGAYRQLSRTIRWAFAGGLLLALAFSVLMARRITQPVQRLVEATRMVTRGEYAGPHRDRQHRRDRRAGRPRSARWWRS